MASEALLLVIVSIFMGALAMFLFGREFFNPYKWAAFRTRFGKGKTYGVVKFRGHGNNLYSKIMDISNDIIKTKQGLFIVYGNAIYRQVGSPSNKQIPLNHLDAVKNQILGRNPVEQKKSRFATLIKRKDGTTVEAVKVSEINEKHLQFEHNVPVLVYDLEDMRPLVYAKANGDPEINTNPRAIEATMEKEVEAAKMLALKMQRKQIFGILIVILIVAGATLAMTLNQGGEVSAISAKINYLNQTMQAALSRPTVIP